MNYTALIIDMRKSKMMSVDARFEAQLLMKNCINKLHFLFDSKLRYDVDFSGGDSVQGVFKSSAAAYLYARLFLLLMYPVPMRCGLGFGTVDIQMEKMKTNAQDDIAYHKAKYSVDEYKDEQDRNIIFFSEEKIDRTINALLLASGILHKNHTSIQHGYQMLLELQTPIIIDSFQNKFKNIVPFMLERVNSIRKERQFVDIENYKYSEDPFLLEDELYFSNNNNSKSKIIINTNRHGQATAIAKAVGVQHQSVTDILNRSSAHRIRDIEAVVALMLLEKYDREEVF
jgi:hypothetical protein